MRGWDLGWGIAATGLALAAANPAPASAQVQPGAYGGGFIEYVANGGRGGGPLPRPARAAPPSAQFPPPPPPPPPAPPPPFPQVAVQPAPVQVIARPQPGARSIPATPGYTLAAQNAGAVVAQPGGGQLGGF